MPGFNPPQDYVFFADESGISNDRFTVVGGVCLRGSAIPAIHDNISAFREKYNMNAELKWTKISNQKLFEYEALVELFFALNNSNHLHFHALIFDSHRVNFNLIKEKQSDQVLSRLYFQLIVHKFARLYPRDAGMAVCLDHRNSSTPLGDLRRMINATLARDHKIGSNPVKQLVSNDSKLDDILQLNDVILGAVCATRNGKHLLENTRPAKRRIAELVLEKSGLTTFDVSSAPGIHRFSVWSFQTARK